jgi:hypothetical protein
MKVKIRGLVFVGFAAAVFAQSAMAVTPPTEANPSLSNEQVDDLKKTVTSKYYVNENFQERLQGNATNSPDTALEEDSNGNVVEKAAFIGWNYGQNNENKEWVKLEGNKQINGTTEYVQIVHDNKNGSKHYVELNTNAITSGASNILSASSGSASDTQKLTTAGAVYGLLDREGTNAGSTLSSSSSDNTVPTSKNVYDFVNTKVTNANITGNVDDGHTQKVLIVTQAWATEQGYNSQVVAGTPTNGDLEHIDHWELIVPDSRIAKTAANITTGGTSNQTVVQENLTTAKAVYDYAQPGATSAAGAQVGVKSGNTSTWYTLAAGQDGRTIGTNTQDVAYTQITRDNGEGTNTAGVYVDLNHERVMLASTYTGSDFQTGIANVTDNIAGAGLALATAGAVKEYVDSITHGNTLPLMPSSCQVENVHCALVSKVVTPASGNDPAVTELEWTVMAQAQ